MPTCAPAAAGISADSGGRLSAVPAPSSALSARIAASEPVEKASAAAATAWASETATSRRAFSTRSASRPAKPASATLGPEEREEERGHGEGRAGRRLDVEGERHPDEEVAHRRQADGRHEQADVAEGEGGHLA